jgi:ribose transport system substrate-binding protein
MITLARPILTTASLLALAMGTGAARAAESCSAYPTGTAESIESSDLASKLGAVPKPGKELRFAYVTKTLINEFWQDVAAGVKNEAAKYGIKVDVQAAKDDSPQSDSNLAPVIKAAIAANIPTVIIDDARTSGASSYIGTDQVKIGAQAATFLHDTNPKGGKVAQIEGAAGSPNARARIKGFKEQLATYPDLQLVASQPGNWDRLTALNATSNILRQNPDLIGIYANNDGMALGVFEAVKNANAAGKTLVVGTDGIREAKKSVQAGEMSATVAEFPFEEGQLGVEVALRLLGCQPVPPWVVSPNAVITKDNVAKFPSPQAN